MWPFKKKNCTEKITKNIQTQQPKAALIATGSQNYTYGTGTTVTGSQSYAYGIGSQVTGFNNTNFVWFSDFVFSLDLDEDKISAILDILNEDACGKDSYKYLIYTILQVNKKKTKHFSEDFLLKYAFGIVDNEIIHKWYSNEIDSGKYPSLTLALEL